MFAQHWVEVLVCFLLAREEKTLAAFTFFTRSPHLSSSSPALAATFSCSFCLNLLHGTITTMSDARAHAMDGCNWREPWRLHAERGVAAVGAVAERGVEAEQLPHALAPRAALAVALGEVADEQLQAPARGVARARRRRRRPPRRADLRAALRADVVKAVHGLAQLHVHALLRALPPPLAPPLHVQNPAHIGQCLAHKARSVVGTKKNVHRGTVQQT